MTGREHLRLVDRRGTAHPDRPDIARLKALESPSLFPGEAIRLGGDECFAVPWKDEEAQPPERFPSLAEHAREVVGPKATVLDSYALPVNVLATRGLQLGRTDAVERPRRADLRAAAGADL